IPAYAGSTDSRSPSCPPGADHPRVRGEHYLEPVRGDWVTGSSPRARGAQAYVIAADGKLRIIPACAGSTARLRRSGDPQWDHPRVRGEHWPLLHEGTTDYGSSPRARGARDRRSGSGPRGRIIPAYAGSTLDDQGP